MSEKRPVNLGLLTSKARFVYECAAENVSECSVEGSVAVFRYKPHWFTADVVLSKGQRCTIFKEDGDYVSSIKAAHVEFFYYNPDDNNFYIILNISTEDAEQLTLNKPEKGAAVFMF